MYKVDKLILLLVLADKCAIVQARLGCNKTDQVDQYCNNCKNGDYSRCENSNILASEGGRYHSECVDVCRNNTDCLGVHYNTANRYCTYLINCAYLLLTAATNKDGSLYRKSCNRDCLNFTTGFRVGFRVNCFDSSFTTLKPNVDILECVEQCADAAGCRAMTYEGGTCSLHFCSKYRPSYPRDATSFFKHCTTPTTTTTTKKSTVLARTTMAITETQKTYTNIFTTEMQSTLLSNSTQVDSTPDGKTSTQLMASTVDKVSATSVTQTTDRVKRVRVKITAEGTTQSSAVRPTLTMLFYLQFSFIFVGFSGAPI